VINQWWCGLSEGINQCPRFIRDVHRCNRAQRGGAYQEDPAKVRNLHVREKRWYEKYYQKDKAGKQPKREPGDCQAAF